MPQFAASVLDMHPVLAIAAIGCALISALLLIWFLWRKPALDGQAKFVLLLGLFVFPMGTATTGNVAGFEHTKNRPFCGSCHVMGPYRADSENPESESLAAAHARNEAFGETNCYECHKEYGAFSTVMTKWGGMRHAYEYYTHYYKVDAQEAMAEFELYKPFANASCMRCHSTQVESWLEVGDHLASLKLVRSGELSCMGSGCHGPAHPFSKAARRRRAAEPGGEAP